MDTVIKEDRLRGYGPDKIRFVESEYQKAYAASQRRRDSLFADLEMYWGDQIPTIMQTHASREGRELVVFNIAQRKVIGLVGSLLQNHFNQTFLSLDGKQTSLIYTLQDMLEVDKNHSNWDYTFMQFLTHMAIYEGCMEMVEVQNIESPLGNLGFAVRTPGSYIIDPNWTSNNGKDIQCVFTTHYMSPKQIIETYGDKEDSIKEALRRDLRSGLSYEERRYTDYQDNASNRGGTYQVIEYQYLDSQKSTLEVETKSGMVLPATDNVLYKQQWLQANGLDAEAVREIDYVKKVLRVVTACPSLNMKEPLEDRLHKFQIERVTVFPCACERIAGEPKGIISLIRDMQITLNKRNNAMNDIIESGANGSAFVSEGIFDGDEKAKNTFLQNYTKPRFKQIVAAGKIESGQNFIQPFPRNNVPPEIFRQIDNLYNDIDRILPVNAASDGRAESSSEPGILFSMKSQAIAVAQTTILRAVQNTLTDMGNAYAAAAKAKYAGIERSFTKPDGTTVRINEVIPLPSGDIAIMNDISSLQPVRTLVKMGTDSPNSRFERRGVALDLLSKLNPNDPDLAEVRTNLTGELVKTIDWSDTTSSAMNEAVQRAIETAKLRAEAQLSQLKAPPAPPPMPGPPPGMPPSLPMGPEAGGVPPEIAALTAGGGSPMPQEPPSSAPAVPEGIPPEIAALVAKQ
jgi:hypothetical protein